MLCPKVVSDIEVNILYKKKSGNLYSIGSLKKDKYICLTESQVEPCFEAMRLMNGTNSLEFIQESLISHNVKLDIGKLYDIISRAGLFENIDETQVVKKEFNEFEFMTTDLFSIPTKWLKKFLLLSRSCLYKIFIFIYALTIIAATLVLVFNPNKIVWTELTSDVTLLFIYLIISIVSVLLHEVAHAFVATRYGIECSKITFSVYYYISLICYIRTPGIYTLSERKRIEVWGAGFATNLFLASLFYTMAALTSGYIQNIFAVIVVSNLINAIACLLPFVYSDGYFILATLLKAPNLRKASLVGVTSTIKNRKIEKKQLIYSLYTLFFVVLGCFFVISRIIVIFNDIYAGSILGTPALEFLKKYANLIILLFIGIIGKFIKLRKR